MNVLIACEESQTVCKAFRERGHRAFSCDLQECSGGHPEWHIQGQYTYHYEMKDWELFECREIPRAPEWDGHTFKDVRRLLSMPTGIDVNRRAYERAD